jgi:hypothetical protein
MRRNLALSLLVFVCLAASARAAEPFVVLVDEERGLLLIPDGTAVPMGMEFSLTPRGDAPRFVLRADAVEEEGVTPRRFVYAYAAPERFTEARRRIAEGEAKFPRPAAELIPDDERKAVEIPAGAARFKRVASNIADFDQTYYYYFWDGSYHAIRKYIHNESGGGVTYTAYGYVYSEAGDWDTKVVVNNTTTGGTPYWNQSKTCYFYNAAGTCTPAIWYLGTYQTVTATITSQAALTRYLYPPCDLPCKSNSSSTVSVSFP